MTNIFTYGSLMYAQVWQSIVSQTYRSTPARLAGFARYSIKNRSYPAIIPSQNAQTQGLVYYHVSDADIALLDKFEGQCYLRLSHPVELNDQTYIQADCYILRPEFEHLLSLNAWSVKKFEQDGLQTFLTHYNGFNKLKS
ncbi:gamma-glutamylcyclotransferase family protein [Catenovulum adriaticum]|uniref:Putative gamma-glutamylcyclotransferase n=1 Tax=Catenovulum adriaticum TaxID=2984846 RepID=A0ABY7AMZ5_9ALTE|nr:gamma-glutamylcyclotransferase family protein [Catenovulum sp. TS8]WAJ70919.1 gamma-glutamylcyclotransferase [Catenovulum sp. TS8]